MKNSNCICIIAIMALVLSSCGSLSISQKRYSRGLNIDWFAAKEDKGAAQKQSTSKSKRTENIIAAEAPAQLDEPVMGGIKTESYVASSVVASKSVAPVSVKTSGVKAGKEVRTKSALGSKIASGIKVNASKMIQKAPLKIAGAKRVDATHDSDVSLLILIILAIGSINDSKYSFLTVYLT